MNQKEITWRIQLQNNTAIKPTIVLNAWRNYCMESWIFRLFVKIGLRK